MKMTVTSYEFYSWAMTWIHRFVADENESVYELTIEAGFDHDGSIVIINDKGPVHQTYVLESRSGPSHTHTGPSH